MPMTMLYPAIHARLASFGSLGYETLNHAGGAGGSVPGQHPELSNEHSCTFYRSIPDY